jgi:hypothetical protein
VLGCNREGDRDGRRAQRALVPPDVARWPIRQLGLDDLRDCVAHTDVTEWTRSCGLEGVTTNSFMVRGEWPPPGGHRHVFALLTVAMG